MFKHCNLEPLPIAELDLHNEILISNIAFLLKQVRLLMGLTVSKAEWLCRLPPNTLVRIEGGGHALNTTTLIRITLSYRLPLSYFIKDYSRKPTRAEWKHLAQMQKELMRYHKSNKRILPQTGAQLQLEF